MDCREVEHWLLEAEDPRAESCAAPAIAGHLHACASCRLLARRLDELEQSWRSLPLPADAQRAKAALLARLGAPPVHLRRPVSRRRVLRWCAASAASLLAVGAGGWLLFSPRETQAADDLLDRLVDWNLYLTQAQSETERSRLYTEQAAGLRSSLDRSRLPPEQAALAEDLLENGAWLAGHRDPIIEADRLDSLADRLLGLARAAKTAGNHRRMNKLLGQYNRVLEAGVDPNLDRAEASGVFDVEHQRRLERMVLGNADRMQQLASLLENAPDASRREIERALGLQRKRAKKSYRPKRDLRGTL